MLSGSGSLSDCWEIEDQYGLSRTFALRKSGEISVPLTVPVCQKYFFDGETLCAFPGTSPGNCLSGTAFCA